MKVRYLAFGIIVPLAACTHLSTLPDNRSTPRDQALNGVPYALPMLQYQLEVTRTLKRCPQQKVFEGESAGDSTTLTDKDLRFQIKVKPTARYVPNERYTVDYQALSSFLKTTGYGMETYPSGTLKSINVSADDHSGEVVKAVAVTAIAVATMAAGSPIVGSAMLVAAAEKPMTTSGITKKAIKPPGKEVDPAYKEALRDLKDRSVESLAIVCTAEAKAAIEAIAENAKRQKVASQNLAEATQDVERSTILANLKKSREVDIAGLDQALRLQNKATVALRALVEARNDLDESVSVTSTVSWPRSPLDHGDEFKPELTGIAKFHQLLGVENVRTITREALQEWRGKLNDRVKAKIDLPTKGMVAQDDVKQSACNAEVPNVDNCVLAATTFTATLEDSLGQSPDCTPANDMSTASCMTTVDEGQPTGRFAMNRVADPGIFIRTPAEGVLVVCRQSVDQSGSVVPPAAPEKLVIPDCPPELRLVYLDKVSAPQLGQLRFLPFASKPFESAQLSVSLREDGSLDKLDYQRTKAAGTEIASTASDVATKVQAYLDQRQTKKATEVTAGRAEAIAQVQFQIDALTKQAALLKLQTPPTADASAAVEDETAKIAAQTALLNAKLAQLNAQAALASAGGN